MIILQGFIMKGLPQVVISLALVLARIVYTKKDLTYEMAVRYAHWEDYLCGIYTEADALRLVRYANNQMKRTLSDHADSRIDNLLVEALGNINQRIPIDRKHVYDSLRIGIKEHDWLYDNPDGPDCKKEIKLCHHLQSIQESLTLRQMDEAYKLAQQLPTINERALQYPLSRQLTLAATLIMYDKSTPDACLPIWKPGANLTSDAKLALVQGVMKIITGEVRPTTTTEACFQLGRNGDDRHCWNALAAIGFAPLLDTLQRAIQLSNEDRLAMEVCIRGQLDPCQPLMMEGAQTSLEGRIRRMLKDFTEQCQWKEAVGKLTDACPNPHATLPLHRSLSRDSSLDERRKEDVARDERWFWIHIYTGQCEKARLIFEHLSSTYGRAEAGSATAFAIRRMQESLRQCQPYKVADLSEAEKSLNIIGLMMEGNFESAEGALAKAAQGKAISPKQIEYYEAVWLMNNYPRILDVSDLISAPLLLPNQFAKNLRIMRSLSLISKGKKLPDHDKRSKKTQPVQEATLLLLAGKPQELLERYETLKEQSDPIMSDLLGTARICLGTRKAFCSPEMDQHVKVALQLSHIRPKARLYENVRELVCEKTTEATQATMDDTKLFEMNATWSELFGHTGRYFKLPNDPKEGILAINHQVEGSGEMEGDESETKTSEVPYDDQASKESYGEIESSENSDESVGEEEPVQKASRPVQAHDESESDLEEESDESIKTTSSREEEQSAEQTTRRSSSEEEQSAEEVSQEEDDTSIQVEKTEDSEQAPKVVAKKANDTTTRSKEGPVDRAHVRNVSQAVKRPIKKHNPKSIPVQNKESKQDVIRKPPLKDVKSNDKAKNNTRQRKETMKKGPALISALRKALDKKKDNQSSEPHPSVQDEAKKQPKQNEQPLKPTSQRNVIPDSGDRSEQKQKREAKATTTEPKSSAMQGSNDDIAFVIGDISESSSSEDNQPISAEAKEESNSRTDDANDHTGMVFSDHWPYRNIGQQTGFSLGNGEDDY